MIIIKRTIDKVRPRMLYKYWKERCQRNTDIGITTTFVSTLYPYLEERCQRYTDVFPSAELSDKLTRGQLNRDFSFTCLRSRLRTWPRETGSAVPSNASLFIVHTQAESGAYSYRSMVGVH